MAQESKASNPIAQKEWIKRDLVTYFWFCRSWYVRRRTEKMSTGSGERVFSCKTASETLEWINAIIEFIEPYRFLIDAHVVNFFRDSLWEAVPKDWMDCLSKDPIQNLLRIPSGLVHDHWPASLKEFVLTLKSLSFPRHQANLLQEFPGLDITSLNNVLAQGMNH